MNGIDEHLVRLLTQDYQAVHGDLRPVTDRQRAIANPPFGDYVIFQTAQRREYNVRRSGVPITECYLCTRMTCGILVNGVTFLVPDPVPFAAQHFLVRFVNTCDDRTSAPPTRVQLATTDQEHRENLTADDIDSCFRLARETGFLVCASMRGSGASVPSHIHVHAFGRNAAGSLALPWLNGASVLLTCQREDTSLYRTLTPGYGILVETERPNVGSQIVGAYEALKLPYNLIVGYGRPFRGYWTFIFWRTRESALHPLFCDLETGRWRFGFSEMLGLFEFKSEEQFLGLTKGILARSLLDVTISDPVLRERAEALLLRDPPGSSHARGQTTER
jgi:hypothetical protein